MSATLRVDLADDEALTALIEMADSVGSPLDADLILALVVTGDADLAEDISFWLHTETDDRGLPIVACWNLARIAPGQRYSMSFGPKARIDTVDNPNLNDPWVAGVL